MIHAHEYIAGPVALSLGALAKAPVIFTEHYSGFGTLPERERRRAKSRPEPGWSPFPTLSTRMSSRPGLLGGQVACRDL